MYYNKGDQDLGCTDGGFWESAHSATCRALPCSSLTRENVPSATEVVCEESGNVTKEGEHDLNLISCLVIMFRLCE